MPVQFQCLLGTCQGAYATADALVDIDAHLVGFLIQGNGSEEASFRAGFAANAVFTWLGYEVGRRKGVRVVPSRPSSRLGAATSAAKADEPVSEARIQCMAHETEFLHLIEVLERLLFIHSLAETDHLEMQGGGTHHDAGPDGEFVLALADSHLLGSGSAWAGDQGQFFRRMVQDVIVGLFSCQDFLVRFDGSVHWNDAADRRPFLQVFVRLVESTLDEILLVKLGCLDVAVSGFGVEVVDVYE
jgi:hypothetical protein